MFPRHQFSDSRPQAFDSGTSYHLARARPTARRLDLLCHSIAHNGSERGRNLNRLSITYVFRPRLRSRLTLGGQPFPRKPKAFGGEDSHFSSTLLIPAFSLPLPPPFLAVRLHRSRERSPTTRTQQRCIRIRSFGTRLEPRNIFGAR